MTDSFIVKDNIGIKDKERRASYVLLKTEKITAALYVVTNYLPNDEPVKWQLRAQSLGLLKDVSHISQTSPREFFVPQRIVSVIDQIVSLIQIAMLNRDVSEMNFSLLRQEYLLLKKFIETGNEPKVLAEARVLPPLSRSHLDSEKPKPQVGLSRATLGGEILGKPKEVELAPTGEPSRAEAIVNFLKKNGWSSLAEVARLLPGVSSKTVQRELSSLVDKGVIKRQGERRWSRYAAI